MTKALEIERLYVRRGNFFLADVNLSVEENSICAVAGKSGSGKSTVMDAIQVVMYGSFHQSFLNKAAEDSKNKRSVLSYLRGAQKDGSFNRGGTDFCSVLAIEIEDVGKESFACVGIALFCYQPSENQMLKNDPVHCW